MYLYDRKNKISIDVLSEACFRRECYRPALLVPLKKTEETETVCARKNLHGCPVKYIEEEDAKI